MHYNVLLDINSIVQIIAYYLSFHCLCQYQNHWYQHQDGLDGLARLTRTVVRKGVH